jgi:hypothetical protein
MLPSTNRFSRALGGLRAQAFVLPLSCASLLACSSSDQTPKTAPGEGDAATVVPSNGGSGGQSSGSAGAGAAIGNGGNSGGISGGGPGVSSDSGSAGSGGNAVDGGAAGACRPLTMRSDAYAFELRIVNTSEFYKVDFPPELMPHCVDQRNGAGVMDPAQLETKCEASYLFKKTAGTAPASAVTESFDVVIPFVPASGLDLTIAKGAKGSTQYELRGLDGQTWITFDGTQKTVHVAREQMTKGGLASRLPATALLTTGPKRGAYLFPWYGSPTGPAGKWVHWDPNAPTLYTPAKGLYDSADPSVIAQQMSEAHSAGLDLLVVSYWDGEKPPMAAYLDAAAAEGIEISAMLETSTRGTGTPRQSVLDQLTALNSYASHAAWLKADGKPVVFVYDRVTSEIDAAPVGATGWDDWAWLAAQLGAKTPIVMFPLLSQWATKGATLFGGAFAFAANSGGGNLYTGSHGDDWAWAWTAAESGALLAIPILPSIGRLRTDADEPNYRNQWHAARSVLPNMIIVNSWNEYHESTVIEPTTAFGTHYLDLTREEGSLYCKGELGALAK